MSFGANPITATQSVLPSNQFPLSSVAVPGTTNGDLTALEGGPISTDSNSNKTAPASVYIKQNICVTGTITSVAASTSSTSLLASNTNRKAMYLFNESTATLYLAFAGSASITAYTVQIPPNSFFEMPPSPIYTGSIYGVWSTINGNARITEMS